jgi:uncharacterized protein
MGRLLIWRGLDRWRAEVASLSLTVRGLRARGTQLGIDPLPYRLDYRLDASEDFITRSLQVEALGDGWARRLNLVHDGEGRWRVEAEQEGAAELPAPGGNALQLEGGLDCDIGLSPLTNVMPIRRQGLLDHPGEVDFLMAWVSVPDLGVHPSRQRYQHVRTGPHVAVVRYIDLGTHKGFTSELELDGDGLVVLYPGLARRVDRNGGQTDRHSP